MSNSAVIITWGSTVAGREQMGLGVFMAALEHYNGLKAKGGLEDVRVYISRQGNVGAVAGMMTLDGTSEQIASLLDSDTNLDLLTKASHVVNDLTVVQADAGDAIPQRIAHLQSMRKQLGI
jgi:glutamate dehydrogenase/leucine dehydrogenase